MLSFSLATTIIELAIIFDHFFTKFQYQGKNGIGYYAMHLGSRKPLFIFTAANIILLWRQTPDTIFISVIPSVLLWIVFFVSMILAPAVTKVWNNQQGNK